ncbi:MAG TPA: DUF417 family protein [Terriglobales bacterium]|nr:DUF417 family protein [Terriglobales bacterium]
MDESTGAGSSRGAHDALRIQSIALGIVRYGLCIVIGWIAAMKYTEYEAVGIQPLIAHSPLMAWMYRVWTVQHATMVIGTLELVIVTLILLRRWSPKACMVGSGMACLMFLITLSFILTTPGWEPTLGGFPALSGGVGEFCIKDIVLFGAALWSFGEAKYANDTKT